MSKAGWWFWHTADDKVRGYCYRGSKKAVVREARKETQRKIVVHKDVD